MAEIILIYLIVDRRPTGDVYATYHRLSTFGKLTLDNILIARALIAKPRVLLADEPTGNLDRRTGQEILTLLRSLSDREKLTVVMVTHDLGIAEQADRVVSLVEGRVEQ